MILQIRQIIFVKEQNCPYVDADGKDQQSYHLLFNLRDELLAYSRLLPVGLAYAQEASIGRVLTHPKVRGTGLGRRLMQESIVQCRLLFGEKTPIRIMAQQYLEAFYQSFGFKTVSEPFLEDGIWHVEMLLD